VPANFDTYRSLRIDEMPAVEVAIVDSREKPSGVGEPGVPPIGPAVANALARLGQQRPQQLPMVQEVA
jgi:isoquinoline 1-oxidoreductase beta subunit